MTPTNFLDSYLFAYSGTQVPRRYIKWAAISILAMTLGRKVYFDMEHFKVCPEFHVCLIGNAASRKSTAMKQGRHMFKTAFPDRPIGPAITSREDIIKYMASGLCLREYEDEKGERVEWRPCSYFINEFTNFISFNPRGMIEFLTDIFENPDFDSSTLARGAEKIPNGFLTILACTTPKNFGKHLKHDIIGEGFSRRIIPVYEAKKPKRVTDPPKSPEAQAAEDWCLQHLLKVDRIRGQFRYDSPETKEWFDQWNQTIEVVDDNVMSGYMDSKDILAKKLAMCLAACEEEPQLWLTRALLQQAIATLNENEDNFERLIAPTGRNEMTVPQQRLLNILESRGGAMPEKEFHRYASLDLTEGEYQMMKRTLRLTDQMFELEGAVMTPAALQKVMALRELEKRQATETPKDGSTPPTP